MRSEDLLNLENKVVENLQTNRPITIIAINNKYNFIFEFTSINLLMLVLKFHQNGIHLQNCCRVERVQFL